MERNKGNNIIIESPEFAAKKILIIFLFCCVPAGTTHAQSRGKDSERGIPFISHYTPKDYSAHVQNWASIQDRRGVMYFGNTSGILEYDGVAWRLIPTEKSTHVRSLYVDDQDRIYVGAYGEIGYLAFDSLGQTYFSSITHGLDSAFQDFHDLWKIFSRKDGIYFHSYKYLFRWSPPPSPESEGKFDVWKAPSFFQGTFPIREKLFIQQRRTGLMEFVNDSLQLIAGGDVFKDSWIFAMMERQDGKIMIVDRTHGLYIYDGNTLAKMNAPANQQIIDKRVFHGIALPDGNFALATNLGGILIIDNDGALVRTINVANGLQNESVTSMYLDREGGLWATLSNGIDRIELNSPFSRFDNLPSESNSIESIIRHRGKIYFAAGTGVFALEDQPSQNGPFPNWKKIDGITSQCWSFASIGNSLLVATSNGLFSIEDDHAVLVSSGHTRSLHRSRKDSTLVFVGKERSLAFLGYEEGEIVEKRIQTGLSGEIYFIDEDPLGHIWCSTMYNGIYRFERDSSGNILPFEHLGLEYGLPTLKNNTARMVADRLLISTQEGIYTFDNTEHRFRLDSAWGVEFAQTEVVHLLADRQGSVWIHGNRNGKSLVGYGLPGSADTYTWTLSPFNRFKEYPIYTVYPDNDGVVWFGGPNGVVRYDQNVKKVYHQAYHTLIRKVLTNQDSLRYSGSAMRDFRPVIDYDHNAMRFEFSAPSYDDESANQFSYFLEGFDKNWSNWTNETKKDYTNLPEGEYSFRVKAKNIYDDISEEGTFIFSILPPWYRSWWAYSLYTLAAGMAIIGIVQWRFRKIQKEKQELERIISERTQEVTKQANQLRSQATKLQELDQAKSRFFANISHEFRTPLTLISGGLEDLAEDTEKNEDQMRLAVMQNNTKRLRQLIEQVLDLSKLESGKLRLNVAPMHPGNFLSAVTSSFSSWAVQKNIALTVDLPEQHILAFFDEDVLEKIVDNLLSNAIKFTPQGGSVSLSAQWNTEELTIRVFDTGPGIPSAKLGQIFERFYQADDSSTRTQEGSGIGLALVKELVSLHHGQIKVESKPGEGTEFRVTIPIHEKYYPALEIGAGQKDGVKKAINSAPYAPTETYPEYSAPTADRPIILIVEDNIDLSHYIGDHLPECAIILAGNGLDGLNKAIQHVPDLIISDVMMPEMDGVELCKKIKEEEKTSHIPIILLTAKADIESRLEGLETGADDYMTKPFDARELQMRVKNLIIQREKLRARFSRTVILKPKDIAITSPDELFLEKVMAIIENHLSDSEFEVEDFQKEIGLSRMQLHRKLKALTGHAAGEFVRIQRLIHASEMLSKTDSNVSEVCYQTGFTSLSYFAKCFKKQFGTTPKEYASSHSTHS